MKIAIISGSGRNNSNSLKLGQYIASRYQSEAITIDLIDLNQHSILLHHYEPLSVNV
ncbi:NADPH-dependent FMN reductase [Pseudoalteromonas sp.]|uniref:NADPH-dependent FMN reductase n=1 Tax=Pseudoalteromonas sp. TaxID=53249 RepID=UPI00356A7637